jgi:hypothetical protein
VADQPLGIHADGEGDAMGTVIGVVPIGKGIGGLAS